jgi:hypothetical protein
VCHTFTNINSVTYFFDFSCIFIKFNKYFFWKGKLCRKTLNKFQKQTNTTIIHDKLLILGEQNVHILRIIKIFLKRFVPLKELAEITQIISNVFIFYTPKDLNIAFRMESMRTYYILKKVQQRRNVYGNFLIEYYLNKNKMKYIFRVKDLKGLTSGGSFFIEITEKKGQTLPEHYQFLLLQKIL